MIAHPFALCGPTGRHDVGEVQRHLSTHAVGIIANATIQAGIAQSHGGNYGVALAYVAAAVGVCVMVLAWLGRERKGVPFGVPSPAE